MKKYIFISFLLPALIAGCKRNEYLLFSDIARIQQADTTEITYTFVYEGTSVVRDTVYIPVNTIGGITDKDRPVKLEQLTEYDYTYVRDPVTNQITDTIATERPFKAVPGKHYVPFDDPAITALMVVKANQPSASLPVILLRDPSLKDNTWRLRVQLAPNSDFAIGETRFTQRAVVFSDRLERFYSWRFDNGVASAWGNFGNYSIRKHQFMIDVLNVQIDENWYQAILQAGAANHYKLLLKDALAAYNSDPSNIASGKAPMRETDSPTSPLISFPN
jgi:hypothetical protein